MGLSFFLSFFFSSFFKGSPRTPQMSFLKGPTKWSQWFSSRLPLVNHENKGNTQNDTHRIGTRETERPVSTEDRKGTGRIQLASAGPGFGFREPVSGSVPRIHRRAWWRPISGFLELPTKTGCPFCPMATGHLSF